MQEQQYSLESYIKEKVASSEKAFQFSNLSLVKVAGQNTENFLQGQVTCDVTLINDETGSLCAVCNHQGRVLAIFYLVKKNNDFYCLLPTHSSPAFIQHLSKYAVFSKVTVEDVTSHYNVYGFFDNNTDYECATENDLSVCRLPGLITRYFAWGKKRPGIKQNIESVTSWRLVDILMGYPTIYPETMLAFTPHMLNLPQLNAVSFSKGCYVGQEVIARTHYLGKSKRHLHRIELSDDIFIKPGEIIFVDGQEAGLIVDAVNTPELTLLLAVLQEPLDRHFFLRDIPLVQLTKL